MTKALGFVDILAGLLFVANFYSIEVPHGLLVTVAVIMMVKGLAFIANFFSWVDIAAGAILIFGFVPYLPIYALMGMAAFLGLKGVASLLAFS